MSLKEKQLFETVDLVAKAIDRLQHFEPEEGYYLAFSGGKDSVVIKHLADMAGVKYDAHYNVTTIDPPELIYFIREHHPDVIWDRPGQPFLHRLVKKGFPLRQARWCCEEYKERGGEGRDVVMGLRWEESGQRKNRAMYEHCQKHNRRLLNPIIEWSEQDVWDFIGQEALPYCSLYDEDFTRLGCVFCPMKSNNQRQQEGKRWPGFEKAFRIAFRKLHENRKSRGMKSVDRWPDGDAMFEWWIGV